MNAPKQLSSTGEQSSGDRFGVVLLGVLALLGATGAAVAFALKLRHSRG